MINRNNHYILMALFGIAAIAVLVIAAVMFFKPQKEPTGNKLLDCVDEDIEISTLKGCFDKYPAYIDKGRIDAMLYGRAMASKDASLCNRISTDDVKFTCIAGIINDKSTCLLIKDKLQQALCLGEWDADSCEILNDETQKEAKRDCLVEISKEPEKCLLLPEEERAFCIALKKKDPLLCPSLPTYYQQIRCMLESDRSFLQKLEEYDLFSNFLDIAVKEKQPVKCNLVPDQNLKRVCLEKFQVP